MDLTVTEAACFCGGSNWLLMKSASLLLRATEAAAVATAADSMLRMNSLSFGRHVLRYTLCHVEPIHNVAVQ